MDDDTTTRPSGGAAPRGPVTAGLTSYVAGWIVLAAMVAGATWWWGLPLDAGGRPPAWLVVSLAVATTVASLVRVEVTVRDTSEATNLNEAAIVPLMIMLPPPVAVAAGLVAALVSEAVNTRWQGRKLAFNVAWQVVGIGLGASAHTALVGTGLQADAGGLLAAALSGVVLVVVNVVAMVGIIALMSGRPLRVVVAEDAPSGLLVNLGTVALGVLVAVLATHTPAALPLLLAPAMLDRGRARARTTAYDRLATDRDLFVQTLDGASDGMALLDRTGRVELWNPRMAELTRITSEAAVGATMHEVGLGPLARSARPGGEVRVDLGDRVVMVRRSGRVGTRGSSVLSLHDVSREAELARIREDLVSRISHEIRTPVTTVSGCVGLLQSRWDDLPDDQRREMIGAAGRGADRLTGLVENLVTLSMSEARRSTPGSTDRAGGTVGVGQVVHEVLTALALPEVTVRGRGEVRAVIPRHDLHMVLRNLLTNATVHGGTPIEVAIGRRGPMVEVAVTDHGPGVPPDFAAQLFSPFQQASAGDQRTAQGMGIGLAVVESLVVASGGTVRHEPVGGGGARFVVTLPAAVDPPAPTPDPVGPAVVTGAPPTPVVTAAR